MKHIDLSRYPLDRPASAQFTALVRSCQDDLDRDGLFNLPGFFTDAAIDDCLSQVKPIIAEHAFTHSREHNIYFDDEAKADAAVLKKFKTTNHTICADQIEGSPVTDVYDWQPFVDFLAAVMEKAELYPMDDRIACANVMTYHEGEALNWHFDRSEFTTTLLLQAPKAGGDFEYVKDLRSPGNPNFEGIKDMHAGRITPQICKQDAGTLNVFRGVNTPHRVTPVIGDTSRIVTVFTYYETPNRRFTSKERLGFYGRDTEWNAT